MVGTRKILFAALALSVVSAGCRSESEPKAEAQGETRAAKVLTVQKKTVDDFHEAYGTIRPQFSAELGSKVLARVVSVNAKEGDTVSRGSLLVALDAREMAAGVSVASANVRAASAGRANAETAATMEAATSQARIKQAEAGVTQAKAGLAAAKAHLDLAMAGPRNQEKAQAHQAVLLAESNLRLAQTELDRATALVAAGALAKKNLDLAQNAFEVAKAQLESAKLAESIAQEGTRNQEIKAAKEAVTAAEGTLRQAEAGLVQARAASLQVRVRQQEIRSAQAQIAQSQAALSAAQVGLSYARIAAPFDGRVVKRYVDPGAMAAPGVPLLGIEGGDLRLEAVVPERVLPQVLLGAIAPVSVDALSAQPLTGKIVEIVPQGNSSSHTFAVRVRLASEGLKSGMFGRVKFRTGTASRLMVPQDATWEREGLHYVYVVNSEGMARLRIVTIGLKNDREVEILSGLQEGEKIVTSNFDEVKDGDRIEAQN